jgi:hypothetical protein
MTEEEAQSRLEEFAFRETAERARAIRMSTPVVTLTVPLSKDLPRPKRGGQSLHGGSSGDISAPVGVLPLFDVFWEKVNGHG